MLLEQFIARGKSKPVKFEVLMTCVVRLMFKMIGKPHSKGVVAIQQHFPRFLELIELTHTNREEIQELLQTWFTTLDRVKKSKNRQYNCTEIKSLFSNYPEFFEIFEVFVEEIVECEEGVKTRLLNLKRWPELDGDVNFIQVMELITNSS